jgi:hypothetical protein
MGVGLRVEKGMKCSLLTRSLFSSEKVRTFMLYSTCFEITELQHSYEPDLKGSTDTMLSNALHSFTDI